jgi:hypothetical protein
MEFSDEIEPVEVFSGTIWQAELLKSMLDDAAVESFLLDEYTGTMAPWYTAGGGAGSVKVVVSSLDFDQAKEIVKEFTLNLKS